MRYLIDTRDYGIVYGNSGSFVNFRDSLTLIMRVVEKRENLEAASFFLLNNGPITWSSQRQNAVSLSTVEAEYIALAHGTKEAVWLKRLLNELKMNCDVVPMYIDNQSAIKLAKNSDFHKRSKHIDVRFHYVRDVLNRNEIKIFYVPSENQLVDIFTKPLSKHQFCNLRNKLMITNDQN